MKIQDLTNGADGAKLIVLEADRVRILALDTQPVWHIGRIDPTRSEVPDIAFESKIVSRSHGRLECMDDQWYYIEEPGNRNGTFHNGKKLTRRKDGFRKPVDLTDDDVLQIDNQDLKHPSSQGVLLLFTTANFRQSWEIHSADGFRTGLSNTANGSTQCTDCVTFLTDGRSRHVMQVSGKKGARLNGVPVSGRTRLPDRSYIRFDNDGFFRVKTELLHITYPRT